MVAELQVPLRSSAGSTMKLVRWQMYSVLRNTLCNVSDLLIVGFGRGWQIRYGDFAACRFGLHWAFDLQ